MTGVQLSPAGIATTDRPACGIASRCMPWPTGASTLGPSHGRQVSDALRTASTPGLAQYRLGARAGRRHPAVNVAGLSA